METIIECPNCGRTIYFGTNPKECVIKSCCWERPPRKPDINRQNRAKAVVETYQDKKDYIMAFISNYRDYLVRSIYDKVKEKIGCYKTFNRLLKELVEEGRLQRMRYGFVRRKD